MNGETVIVVDWHLVGVGPSADDPGEFIPFVYTVDLGESKNETKLPLPELWIRCRGTCGHTLGIRAAGWVINQAAEKLIRGALQPGGRGPVPSTWSEEFHTGTLTFTLEEGLQGAQDLLETYQAPADAVMVPISWACCEGKIEQ